MVDVGREVACLREQGYVLIRGGMEVDLADHFRSEIASLYERLPRPPAEDAPHLNKESQFIYSLQNKHLPLLKFLLRHQRLRSILMSLLNDRWYKQIDSESPNYILRAFAARSGGPSLLPLHIDSFIPSCGQLTWSVQVALILEDQTVRNGCLAVVPGSHLLDRYASQEDWKDAVPVESRKGDLILWDSRLWHGCYPNTEGSSRWVAVGTFVRWWLKQNFDITGTLQRSFYDTLTDEERAVLGYCSLPPRDEFDRQDIKAGYGILRKREER